MSTSFQIQKNFDLSRLNSFGLPSHAEQLIEIENLDQLPEIQKWLMQNSTAAQEIKILGGGSNLILPEQVNGLVLRPQIRGKKIIKEDQNHYYVQVGAAESWHEFVLWSLDHSLFGLENLALIPGQVGASPIQNIGAYGVEVNEFIEQVLIYDFASAQFKELNNQDCQFRYRHSIFKEAKFQHALVCHVVFRLNKTDQAKVEYKDLKLALGDNTASASAKEVCAAVIKIRTQKLPDPKVIGNVGSFFKNPIIDQEKHERLVSQFPNLVSYPQLDASYKLAAAWLIDQCGFKGQEFGHVKMHEKQALVMVNIGSATKEDVQALKIEIQQRVLTKFEVQLDPEPVFW